MKTFLEHVAKDIIAKHGSDLSRVAIVFPNKRAALFMNEALARMVDHPIWSPAYMTISELFRSHSTLRVADTIKQVCDLHKSYVECTGIDETLDHFYGWGQLMLGDFDDIDKNMADAKKVFANVRDIHELDSVSYLTDEQVATLRKFFSNFSADHDTELKRRFLKLWCHFANIYTNFNDRLSSQGLAYEGALYRKVACDEGVTFEYEKYIFVGFNMTQKVEQRLFQRLKDEDKAFFYWDFDDYYMPRKGKSASEAGHYISQYLRHFPNELDTDDEDVYRNFEKEKSISFISAPTENIQARYVSRWLGEHGRIADGKRTAIVLCDEGLLKTVIHCLPDSLDKVNVTTGYPLASTPFKSLIGNLINLNTLGYIPTRGVYRLKYVNAVLRHPYMLYISDHYATLIDRLNTTLRKFFPDREQLVIDEGTAVLFREVKGDSAFTGNMVKWIIDVLKLIASKAKDNDDPLFGESLFRTYTLMNRLGDLIDSGDLTVDIVTLQRLIDQLISTTSVPFHGEPAVGVQIMGVLETRNLDFDHVLILSCNEGNMPKGVNDTSFIPYSIRKAYELTTIDNKVAIYAYYFYRLLQRASDITIVFNDSTDDGTRNEMSRFMLQLLVESRHEVKRLTLQAGQTALSPVYADAVKTAKVMDTLRNRFDIDRSDRKDKPLLTPTAINRYMRCQKQFYYNYVCGIAEPDTSADDDSIDGRLFGNIFHKAAEAIYRRLTQQSSHIVAADLQRLLKSQVEIEMAVDEAFKEEFFNIYDKRAKMPELNGLQLINREVIITYLRRLLEIDTKLAPFEIVGLEHDVCHTMTVGSGDNAFTTTVGGRIDRLDRIDKDGTDRLRVVDYKTGGGTMSALKSAEDIFSREGAVDHSDYYLQTFLYGIIVDHDFRHSVPVSPALLFIQHSAADDFDPTLRIGKEPTVSIADYAGDFISSLHAVTDEMFNPDVPFKSASDTKVCQNCPYKQFCTINK